MTEVNAPSVARRCLRCDNCFERDRRYGACPDDGVIGRGAGMRFQFNHDPRKGCGIGAAECPCGAIDIGPETFRPETPA